MPNGTYGGVRGRFIPPYSIVDKAYFVTDAIQPVHTNGCFTLYHVGGCVLYVLHNVLLSLIFYGSCDIIILIPKMLVDKDDEQK